MGHPQPERQPVNVAGLFVVLAVLAGLGLLVLAAVLVGWSFFRISSGAVTATPAPVMKTAVAMNAGTRAEATGSFDLEIDQEGNVSLDGQQLPLEQIEALLQMRLQAPPMYSSEMGVRVEEGCPFEHVQAVRDMYQRLGLPEPKLTTVPPRREVIVEVDAEGKPTLDGEPVSDISGAFQQIAQKHGSRATLTLHIDPQCPAEAVVQIQQLWTDAGLGEVKIADEDNSASH
jgi:biopolymer transport protein ExbD